jgi:hypothetical protein
VSGSPPRRRGRTRWLLLTPIATLVAVVVGVVALESIGPTIDPGPLVVEGVPPLALEEAPECTRGGIDEGAVPDIREDLEPGDRIASEQVFACPSAFDGFEVTFVGEAVGELIRRRDGVWVQVNDDPYALEVGPLVGHRQRFGSNSGLSVWLPDGLHERITDVGRPSQRGDVIAIRGTLLRTDPDDGGGITVRADALEVLAPAEGVHTPLHVLQAVVAGVLAVVAIAAVVWSRLVRRR